jgi:hypothetical protein
VVVVGNALVWSEDKLKLLGIVPVESKAAFGMICTWKKLIEEPRHDSSSGNSYGTLVLK